MTTVTTNDDMGPESRSARLLRIFTVAAIGVVAAGWIGVNVMADDANNKYAREIVLRAKQAIPMGPIGVRNYKKLDHN